MSNYPKRFRKFKNARQIHYCVDKPKTIDEYTFSQEESVQENLNLWIKL